MAYRLQTNGKVQRLIKTLQNEWAPGYRSPAQMRANSGCPGICPHNRFRAYMALDGRTPLQQLQRLRVT